MITVTYVNNTGGGFSEAREVQENTTISEFIAAQTGDVNFDGFTIRVNRETTSRDYVLQDGDKITCVPTGIKGA